MGKECNAAVESPKQGNILFVQVGLVVWLSVTWETSARRPFSQPRRHGQNQPDKQPLDLYSTAWNRWNDRVEIWHRTPCFFDPEEGLTLCSFSKPETTSINFLQDRCWIWWQLCHFWRPAFLPFEQRNSTLCFWTFCHAPKHLEPGRCVLKTLHNITKQCVCATKLQIQQYVCLVFWHRPRSVLITNWPTCACKLHE